MLKGGEFMKLSESQILEFRLEMESLICEREGMIALNKERERHNDSLAYGEDAFVRLAMKFDEIHSAMIILMEK